MIKSKYFPPQFFIPPIIFNALGDNSWTRLDNRLINTIDLIKELFNGYELIANTYYLPKEKQAIYGHFEDRGYRDHKTSKIGSKTGAHYKGMGIDIDFYLNNKKQQPKIIIDKILSNRNKLPLLCGLELDVNWNHIDVMCENDSPSRIGIGGKSNKIILFNATGSVIKIV